MLVSSVNAPSSAGAVSGLGLSVWTLLADRPASSYSYEVPCSKLCGFVPVADRNCWRNRRRYFNCVRVCWSRCLLPLIKPVDPRRSHFLPRHVYSDRAARSSESGLSGTRLESLWIRPRKAFYSLRPTPRPDKTPCRRLAEMPRRIDSKGEEKTCHFSSLLIVWIVLGPTDASWHKKKKQING